MKNTYAALCMLALLCSAAAAEVRFEHHFIDSDGPRNTHWSSTAVGDLNNDGLPDVIVGRAKWGDGGPRGVYWYENKEGGIGKWSGPRPVKSGVHVDCGAAAVDVDGDGWTDVVCDGVWFRNPAPPAKGQEFTRHVFDADARGAHDVVAHDMDGDEAPELVVHVEHPDRGGVFIYEVPDDPTETWPRTVVRELGDVVHGAIAPAGVGDVSGDGAPDIIFLNCWYENPAGQGTKWKKHANFEFRDAGRWGPAVRCFTADIDGDGRMDFVQSQCDVGQAEIAWFRNVNGDGSEWEKHPLPQKEVPGDLHSLVVKDFDLDGDPDIYADELEHIHVPGGQKGNVGMYAWENLDGKGAEWRRITVKTGLGGHQAKAADFDGDGDPDIVTRPYTANNTANDDRMHLSVLENLAR